MKTRCWWLFAAMLLASGCGSKATQVIVTIDAEEGVRAAGPRMHVVVLGGVGRTTAPTASRFDRVLTPGIGDPAYPLKFVLAPLDGDVGRSYSVTATAETSGTPSTSVAQARVIGGYVEGETQYVRLVLEDACLNVSCGDELTCKAGICVDARTGGDVDAGVLDAGVLDAEMPDAGQPDDGGHDAGPDAAIELDGGTPGIVLHGDFVSGAASGSAGGITLRGAFTWTGNLSGSASGITLRGHVQ
jgi:hypothetical protein